MKAKLLPDDFCPQNREQAAMLANERGCAWYMPQETYSTRIYFVKKSTPLSSKGEDVLGYHTTPKHFILDVVRELNRAHLLGFRCRRKLQTT